MADGHGKTIVATALTTIALMATGYYAILGGGRTAPKVVRSKESIEIDRLMQPRPLDSPPAPAPAAEEPLPDPPKPDEPPATLEELVSRSMPAVVRVETGGGFGSGFFIRRDTILTNVHVVTSNYTVTVRMPDGKTHPARVDSTAPELDIAVLRLNDTPAENQAVLAMGSATRARQGQEVIVLGTPLGLQNTVTRGIVSAVRQVGPITLVQTDAAVNPGNSGGPVLDRQGRVIGIATMTVRSSVAQGLSFAVAIDHAQALLEGRRPSGTTDTPIATLSQAMGTPPGSAPPSEADSRREAGTRAYEQFIVNQIARRADALEDRWRSFKRVCVAGNAGAGFSREWFALYQPQSMAGAVSPGCAGEFSTLQERAREIDRLVRGADEAARQAGVYPGARRDILRRNRLDYGGWDR
jgi:S1-C subfamily serine protease